MVSAGLSYRVCLINIGHWRCVEAHHTAERPLSLIALTPVHPRQALTLAWTLSTSLSLTHGVPPQKLDALREHSLPRVLLFSLLYPSERSLTCQALLKYSLLRAIFPIPFSSFSAL